jgi:hypothetical protein
MYDCEWGTVVQGCGVCRRMPQATARMGTGHSRAEKVLSSPRSAVHKENAEIQRYRDTEIQRYRDTEIDIQRYRDTEIQSRPE